MLRNSMSVSIVLASLAFSGGALAQTAAPGATAPKPSSASVSGGSLAGADLDFVNRAAEDSLAEVELGGLAREKAQDARVKQFGERMVKDHTKAGADLKRAIEGKSVVLADKLDARDANQKDRLAKLTGTSFDRAYLRHTISEHKKVAREFEKQAKSAKDPEVKKFASSSLPVVQEHLKLAQSIQAALKAEASTKSTAPRASETK